MKSLIYKLWHDENFSIRVIAVLIGLLSFGFTIGYIPTEVDGMGPKVGGVLNALALGIATGKWKGEEEIKKEEVKKVEEMKK